VKAEQNAALRRAVLEVLSANPARYGLRVGAIRPHLATFGFGRVAEAEVEGAMGLLEARGMIAALEDPLSPGVRAWRITDEGRSVLEEGL